MYVEIEGALFWEDIDTGDRELIFRAGEVKSKI